MGLDVLLAALAVALIACLVYLFALLKSNRRLLDEQLRAEQRQEQIHQELATVKDQAQATEIELTSELRAAETRLEEQRIHHKQLNEELLLSRKQLEKDFESLSSRLFEDSRKKFDDQSKRTLDTSLGPLKNEIESFRKRVDDIHVADVADRNKLKGQMEQLQKQAQQIGQDAVQLASALKGDSKSRGNWGELVLERLLEDSGLVKGREYDAQVTLVDQQGQRRIPDVILYLPDKKSIVIDSKVSLVAYERYCSTDDEKLRDTALKEHLQSLRTHFADLSRKSYENLTGIHSLDFVLMFVPVEPAYILALQKEPGLFQQAYDRGVVMVSPTTLMVTLKTVANIWRYEKQNRYAQQIADSAGGLYDQFALVVESLDELGKKIDSTQKAYELTRGRLSEGKGNLVRRVDSLKKLGAKSKKQMPDSVKPLLED